MLTADKPIGNYIIRYKNQLGQGSYGFVYLATHKQTNEVVACKIVNKQGADKALLDREKDILYQLSSLCDQSKKYDNLVKLIEYDITENRVYLFSEFCDGGNLADLIKEKYSLAQNQYNNELPSGFTLNEVKNIMSDIVNCYKFLFQLKIVHRDLKPENILIKNNKFKIGDFGFAKHIEGNFQQPTQMTEKRCTPIYGAPQVFSNLNSSLKYSALCDIWSLGLIFYQLVFGEKPYPENTKTFNQLMFQLSLIKEFGIKKPNSKECSNEIWKLLTHMLQYEEINRMTWDQCFDTPFFQQKQQKMIYFINEEFNGIGQKMMEYKSNNSDQQQPTQFLKSQNIKIKQNYQLQDEEEKQNFQNNQQIFGYQNQIPITQVSDNIYAPQVQQQQQIMGVNKIQPTRQKIKIIQ